MCNPLGRSLPHFLLALPAALFWLPLHPASAACKSPELVTAIERRAPAPRLQPGAITPFPDVHLTDRILTHPEGQKYRQIDLDWAELDHAIREDLQARKDLKGRPLLGPNSHLEMTVIEDHVTRNPVNTGQPHFTLTKRAAEEQFGYTIEYSIDGVPIYRNTMPALAQTKNAQNVSGVSFENLPRLGISLPESWKNNLGIDDDLARWANNSIYNKIVWVVHPDAPPELKELGADADIKLHYDVDPKTKRYYVTRVDIHNPKATAPEKRDFSLDPKWLGVAHHGLILKVDAAFNGNSFFWDDMEVSGAIALSHPHLAMATVDFHDMVQAHNPDAPGAIPREELKKNLRSHNPYEEIDYRFQGMDREHRTGNPILDFRRPNANYPNPYLKDQVEWDLYSMSDPREGKARLSVEINSSQRYAKWLYEQRRVTDRHGNLIGFYTSDLASGADNNGRDARRRAATLEKIGKPEKRLLHNKNIGWIDVIAQQAEIYRSQGRMYRTMGDWAHSDASFRQAQALDRLMQNHYWSKSKHFFFDSVPDAQGNYRPDSNNPTFHGFWPLWSGSANPPQVEEIVQHWLTDETFGGDFPIPSLPRNHPNFFADGHYWLGGHWPVVINKVGEAFEKSGRPDIAFQIASKFLRGQTEVSNEYGKTHDGKKTVAEFYGEEKGPDGHLHAIVGREPGHETRLDFTGWGATPPMLDMFRRVVGLRPVPGFTGPKSEIPHWIDDLQHHPLYRDLYFAKSSPFAGKPSQQALMANGYFEWNLFKDLGRTPMTVRNVEYQGTRVEELTIRKVDDDTFDITAKSDQPFAVQVSRAYQGQGTNSQPLANPTAMSQVQLVGGKGETVTTRFSLKR